MPRRLAPGLCFAGVAGTALLLAGSLAAQGDPSHQSPNRGTTALDQFGGRTYSISGRVLDEATSAPIEGAVVELSASIGVGLQQVWVDSTGTFRFTDLSRGTYYLTAHHPNYEDSRKTVEVAGPVGGVWIHLRPKPQAAAPVIVEPLDVAQELIPKEARQEFELGAEEFHRQNFAEALVHLDKALELYPKYVSALHAKGLVHLRRNELAAAQTCFERAAELNPNVAAPRVLLGGIYNAGHRYPQAREQLLRAVQLSPQSWLAHFELSRADWGLNDVDGAEEQILRAYELNPRVPQIHLMRANVYLARQNYQAALGAMDDFLKLVPDVVPEGPFADGVRQRRAQVAARLAIAPRP